MASGRKRPERLKRFVPNAKYYDIDPDKDFPQTCYCRNVMCRRRWMREYGESEFCLACRKMLERK